MNCYVLDWAISPSREHRLLCVAECCYIIDMYRNQSHQMASISIFPVASVYIYSACYVTTAGIKSFLFHTDIIVA